MFRSLSRAGQLRSFGTVFLCLEPSGKTHSLSVMPRDKMNGGNMRDSVRIPAIPLLKRFRRGRPDRGR